MTQGPLIHKGCFKTQKHFFLASKLDIYQKNTLGIGALKGCSGHVDTKMRKTHAEKGKIPFVFKSSVC